MSDEQPTCGHHENEVPMELRTLHSEMSRPGQLLAVFACPECGHERRLPVGSAA